MFMIVYDYNNFRAMTILKFTDGEEFDTSGSLRKEYRADGWYVIGENRLIPVKDELEADEYIARN